MRKSPVNQGFTLVELLIAVSLTVILTGIIGAIFYHSVEAFMHCDAQVQIYSNARHVFDFMTREIFGIFSLESGVGSTETQPVLALMNEGADETLSAADAMKFKTLAVTSGGVVQPVTLWYFLRDTGRTVFDQQTNDTIPVYTLRRRLCELTDDNRDLAGEEAGGSDISQYIRALNIDRIPYGGENYVGIRSGTDGYRTRVDVNGRFMDARVYYYNPASGSGLSTDKRLPRGIRVTMWIFDHQKRQDRVLTKYFMINSR